MNAKDELNQYKYMKKRVDETLQEYEKYKTRAEKMTATLSDVPSRSNVTSDKVGDNASIMADLEKQYEQRWIDSEYKKLEIEKKIDKVEEPYRTILHMRYIEDMSIEAISIQLNSNYTYTCEQHGTALKKYENSRAR